MLSLHDPNRREWLRVGGLSVATFFTLIIVPVFYVMLEYVREHLFKIDPVAAKKRLEEKL